eukprot:CAMPEP_0178715070 /NCGR_PEP_ID=MMETSP0699-20121125/20435_1 /TAXON_ID=265572 /ORGANISM="Extubocellulus spinifer, Strain CCMP396" /LENGTH=41 /DNA_ID= /DNA_START= /DNA_END= /DNA_ORIENTATION=
MKRSRPSTILANGAMAPSPPPPCCRGVADASSILLITISGR